MNKKELAKKMNVCRQSLYYQSRLENKDLKVKSEIEKTLAIHHSYGHRRIALYLKINKKRILRIMNKYGIKPYRRRTKRLKKKNDLNKKISSFSNLLLGMTVNYPNQVWQSDFTYLKFQNRFVYLAVVLDGFTKEIIGWNFSVRHNTDLVIKALTAAISNRGSPTITHSDQGSEYRSKIMIDYQKRLGIKISMSNKSSPWQNACVEGFFSQFKLDMGDINRFINLDELTKNIADQIYYYNYQRIQLSLRMTPKLFADNYIKNQRSMMLQKENAIGQRV